jgi:pimeloyl-ACP methyl ester carboxylesterase
VRFHLGIVKSFSGNLRAVLDSISGNAPRDVIFVHGAGGNKSFWKRTFRYLTGDGTAVAVDLPGHPSGEITCRTIGEYAEAVHRHVAESLPTRPVICGHSMGSAIALALALAHPDDLGGLILVGAGAKLGVDPVIVEGLRANPMRTIEQTITPMSYFRIDLGMGREARAALSFTNLPVFLNDYLACDGFDVRSRLSEISADTFIICGENDRMTPPKWSVYLNQNIRRSSMALVREAGHMAPLEKPEACAGLILDFLTRLSP